VLILFSLQRIGADLREGWQFVLSAKWFWIGLPIAALGNVFFSGPLDVALPRLVQDSYGAGAWLLGTLNTAVALGALLATIIVGQMQRKSRRGLLMYLAVALASVAELLLGLPYPQNIAPFAASFADSILGFGLGTFGIIWVVIMQEMVPIEKLGRVSSIDQLGAWSLLPITFTLTGFVTDHIGAGMVFIIGGSANLVLALLALAIPDIRKVN
jgi:DHA3 family tetracycline resistance protein-like MFS transporter